MATARALIKNAYILSLDPTIGVVPQGNILIEDGKIRDIGVDLQARDADMVDLEGALVLPGLVDTHRHTWQTALRALGADFIGPDYRNCIKGGFALLYTPEDVYYSTLAGVLEALDSGVTTILDWAHIMNSPDFADASIDALEASGTRAVFAHAPPNDADSDLWWNNSNLRHPGDARRVRNERLSSDSGLVTMALGVRPPHLVTDEVMEHDWSLARELGLRITADGGLGGGVWGGTPWGADGYEPVKKLQRRNLLGSDTTYVHCNNLSTEELELIASTGGTVSISPDSEMQLGFSVPATGRCVEAGIRPAISTDLVMQVGGNMFGAMRTMLNAERGLQGQIAYERGRGPDQWRVTTKDVLEFATIEGARAIGNENIGSLSPGKAADLIVLNTNRLHLQPTRNPIGLIVNHVNPGDVNHVMVAGRWMKWNGQLVDVDVKKVLENLNRSADRMYEEMDITNTAEYRPRVHDDRWNW